MPEETIVPIRGTLPIISKQLKRKKKTNIMSQDSLKTYLVKHGHTTEKINSQD